MYYPDVSSKHPVQSYRIALIVLLFSLILFGTIVSAAGPSGGIMRKGPYLIYPNTTTSMTVMWQTTTTPTGSATISWKPESGSWTVPVTVSQSGSGQDQHLFSYTITGLTANKNVGYKVTVNSVNYEGSFRTAPDPSATSLSFYAYGDTRTYPNTMNSVLGALLEDMNTNPGSRQTFCLHGGDFTADGLDESYWDSQFFNLNYANTSVFLREMPVMGALGNHELYSSDKTKKIVTSGSKTEGTHDNRIEGAAHQDILFYKYFPYPEYVIPGASKDMSESYYSFDYGPVHVAVIDAYPYYNTNAGNYLKRYTQFQWLTTDLGSSTAPYKIVMVHPPPYSAGLEEWNFRKDYQTLIQAKGVKLVIAGHNHFYARNVVNGVTYLTLGGGGAPLVDPKGGTYVIKKDKENHFARIDLSGATMTGSVYNMNNKLIDSFSI